MQSIVHIALGLLGLSFVVLIHELGHFAAARLCKVHVERVCLFLGKPLLRWKWGRTEFAVAWLPLGGYCKMKDEGLALQDLGSKKNTPEKTVTENAAPSSEEKRFQEATPLQKIFIVAAGPLVNILFAFVVIFLFQLGGHLEVRESNRIVVPDSRELQQNNVADQLPQVPSPAERAGLQSGDVIRKIGNSPIESFQDLRLAIALRAEELLGVEYLRDGEFHRTQLQPVANSEGQGWIGVSPWRALVVRKLASDSAAYRAGIRTGMRLIAVNGRPVAHWYDLLQQLQPQWPALAEGSSESAAETQPVTNFTLLWQQEKQGQQETGTTSEAAQWEVSLSLSQLSELDFLAAIRVRTANPWQAAMQSVTRLSQVLDMQVRGLIRLFSGRLSWKDNLAGPIQISDRIGQIMTRTGSSFGERWYASWQFLSLISFMIALANLLPLAVLDGGQILLYSTELLVRRPLPRKWITIYQSLGNAMIIALMVLVLGFELWHYLL